MEAFLDDVVRKLLSDVNKDEPQLETKKAKKIRELEEKLKENGEVVIVLMDKTNSFRTIEKEKYIQWVYDHLKEVAKEVSIDKLMAILNKAYELLNNLEDTLSPKEKEFIVELLKTKAVPMPKLLIKDHKKADNKGEYPMQLVVPATNFMVAFPKAGYLEIKAIFDKNCIEYQKSTIIHAAQLKEKMEKLNIKQEEVTIISFDAVDMYPSIKYKLGSTVHVPVVAVLTG